MAVPAYAAPAGAQRPWRSCENARQPLAASQSPSGHSGLSFGPVNEVASVNGTGFSHDASGNLLADATRTCQWGAENRLIGRGDSGAPGNATTFGYDGRGRRGATTSSGVTQHGVTGTACYG